MTSQQTIIMWLGLALVLTRLFSSGQWSDIWQTIAKGNGSGSSSSGNTGCPSGQTKVAGQCMPNPLGIPPITSWV